MDVTSGEIKGAMDQGAIDWAMDVTSGEIDGAMDHGAILNLTTYYVVILNKSVCAKRK